MKDALKDIPKIILIDDSEWDLFLHQELLLLFGIKQEVETYTSARLALQYLKEDHLPNSSLIILVDLHMPDMDGLEFIDHFSNLQEDIRRNIKLFLLSSTVDYDEIRRVKSYDCIEDIFCKPLDVNKLLNQLQEHQLAGV